MSTSNPFETTERWEVSLDEVLPKGNYVAKITEATDSTVKSSGNPQIDLKFQDLAGHGAIRAWEAYHSEFLRKVSTLYDCAGVRMPQPGEFDPSDRCRISQPALDRLVGATVGIVVREEPRQDDPTKMRTRVAGYVEPSRITGGPDTSGLPDPGSAYKSSVADDRVPF